MSRALTGLAVVLFFCAYSIAQTGQELPTPQPPSKIRIVFPAGTPADEIWLAYGLYTPGRIGRYIGLQGVIEKLEPFPVPPISGQGHLIAPKNAPAFYEIDGLLDGKRVERFQALVWVPGCKMVYFDVPEILYDVEERFTCGAAKEITLMGRIRGVDLPGSPPTLWVNYDGMIEACFQLHTCDHGCAGNCLGTTILDIASTTIAADGSFRIRVPDFSDDQLMSRGGLIFLVGESQDPHHIRLKPESQDMSNELGDLKIAPSYPSELGLVPNEKWKW